MSEDWMTIDLLNYSGHLSVSSQNPNPLSSNYDFCVFGTCLYSHGEILNHHFLSFLLHPNKFVVFSNFSISPTYKRGPRWDSLINDLIAQRSRIILEFYFLLLLQSLFSGYISGLHCHLHSSQCITFLPIRSSFVILLNSLPDTLIMEFTGSPFSPVFFLGLNNFGVICSDSRLLDFNDEKIIFSLSVSSFNNVYDYP